MSITVQPIGMKAVSTAQTTLSKSTNPIIKNSVKQDSFEKSNFDINQAMKDLENLKIKKKGKTQAKFNQNELSTLRNTLSKTPEKWDAINALAQKRHIGGKAVITLSKEPTDKLNVLREYSDVLLENSKPKFKAQDLIVLARSANTEELQKGKPLTATKLSMENIILIAQTPELKDTQKVANKVLDMQKACGVNLNEIAFLGDLYDKEAFTLIAVQNDTSAKVELLDKNLNRQAIENSTIEKTANGKTYQIKKVNDLRNNTTSKVRLELDDQGNPNVTHEVRILKDKNNNLIRTEYTSPSEIKGIFNITYKDAKGNTEIVSSGKVDKKTGITSIKKNMVSLDGTKTEYLYENDPQGNRINDYKITDKNGKVLLQNSNSFEVINDNKFISSKNKDKYEINITDKGIEVQDLNNKDKKALLSIATEIKGNKKELMKSLKQMSGEELMKLDKVTKQAVGIDNPLESFYDPEAKEIHTGGDCVFVILHELGHATDFRNIDATSDDSYNITLMNSLSYDKDVNKVFDEEKAAFNKAFPDTQRDHLDYFLDSVTHYGGEKGGLGETIAESNALLNTAKSHELLAIRSQYLQQYFPRTIATLSEKLDFNNL